MTVLHSDSWREPVRDRVLRWLFVRLVSPGYREDMAAGGFGELQSESEAR